MKIYEIGTGYTSIPAQISAATEIVVEELTKAFLKQNIPVEIIDIAAENRAKSDLPIREVRVPKQFWGTDVQLGVLHKLKRVVYSIALVRVLRKLLKETNEKVVLHFHNQYNLFFFLKLTSVSLRRKCVIVYTNHSGIWRLPWSEIKGTIKKRYFQEMACMKQADLVFLLNEETKRNIVEHLGVKESAIVVIDNGVNTDVYHPLTTMQKQAIQKQLGLEKHKMILQVGSVYENKGQLRSLEYLLPLLKRHTDLVFAYAGGIVDEAYHQQILSFAEDQGLSQQVRYLGMLSPGKALNELYNAATVTILSSRFEAFVLVAIESLAAGVPVLIDRMGPIQLNGGYIAYERETFVQMLEPIICSGVFAEYEKLCAEARVNAVECYSWDKIAQDYKNAWENLEK